MSNIGLCKTSLSSGPLSSTSAGKPQHMSCGWTKENTGNDALRGGKTTTLDGFLRTTCRSGLHPCSGRELLSRTLFSLYTLIL